MGAPDTAQGAAAVRFAPYIEELQEFFASSCLRYGSPEDIIALTDRLDSSPMFADDLSSMIRSIVLREGGELQHSQLLEIMAIAIGGQKMDHAPQQYGQPLRNLLSFMTGVLLKPWNEPPETVRVERAEVLPFPTRPRHAGERGHGQAAAISAATERAAYAEHARRYPAEQPASTKPERMPLHSSHDGWKADPLTDVHRERRVPDPVGPPTAPARSVFDPHMPEDQAFEDPDLPEDETSDADTSTAVTLPAPTRRTAAAALAAAAAQAHAPAASEPAAPAPTTAPVIQSSTPMTHPSTAPAPPQPIPAAADAPSWQLAAEAVRGVKHAPASEIPVPLPVPEVTHAAAPSPEQRAGMESDPTERPLAAPGSLPSPPSSPPPPLTGSVAQASRKAPEPVPPMFHYKPHVPRTPAGMLVAGAALLVVAGIFAASLHRTTELTGKQAPAGSDAGTLGELKTAITQPKPTAQGTAAPTAATAPQKLLRVRRAPVDEEEDADERGVAPPFSTPIPGQPAPPKPSPYGTQVTQQPAPVVRGSRPPSDEVAATSQPQQPGSPAGHEYASQSYAGSPSGFHPGVGSAYRNPDAAIAGDLPRSGGSRSVSGSPEQVEVSSGMMAGYLISAPKPDYPGLARIAHIGGPVVLQAVLAKNGSVLATHVLSGHRLLRGAAQDAVRRWRFRPYIMDGHPVEVSTIITVRFNPKH